MKMVKEEVQQKIFDCFNNKFLVVEGANGSIGLSLATVLIELGLRPNGLLLTTKSSEPHKVWRDVGCNISHLTSESPEFLEDRKTWVNGSKGLVNVIYGAGYGRPNHFLSDPGDVIKANVDNLLDYQVFTNIDTFCYLSTSELYSGSRGKVAETSPLPTQPQHPRGIYIEAKRMGESIVNHILKRKIRRVASYRIALATPPWLLKDDTRVLSDLIRSAISDGEVVLKGGAQMIRQYQYGPNAVYKIIGSIANGTNELYNNAGSHQTSLGALAGLIGKIFAVPVRIIEKNNDISAPDTVEIDSGLIQKDSGYLLENEDQFEDYLRKIIYASA